MFNNWLNEKWSYTYIRPVESLRSKFICVFHFRCFIPCLGWKIITALSCKLWKGLKNEKRLVTHCYSLRGAPFDKIQNFRFTYSAIPLFYSLFRVKNHLCIELYKQKAIKNWKRLVASRYSLWSARFARYRFLNLHILHFRCFIPCLGYRTEESDRCDTGYVHFSTWLFISFHFTKYSMPARMFSYATIMKVLSCCCCSEWAWSERARQLSNQQKITL